MALAATFNLNAMSSKTKTISLSKIEPNLKNPRHWSDAQLQRLAESIQSFPKMMALRPIVVATNAAGNYYPLGGNMRRAALLSEDQPHGGSS